MKNVSHVIYMETKGSSTTSKPVTPTYVQSTPPTDASVGDLWIDTSKQPPKVLRYDGSTWKEVAALDPNVYIGTTEPSDPYDGLIWLKNDTLKLYAYISGSWQEISGGSTTVSITGDGKTVKVDGNKVSVLFNNSEKDNPGYVWDNKRIQKEALIKALIFG